MAGRGDAPVRVRDPTRDEIDRGIEKLRRRIRDVRELDPGEVRRDDARVKTVETDIRETIRAVFGQDSPEFRDHQYDTIWHGSSNMYDTEEQRHAKFAAGIPQTATMLEGLVSRLEERRADLPPDQPAPVPAQSGFSGSRRVFVVHGHDDAAKEAVARFLEKLDLEPIILHEQANQGLTIIEKFERHSDVDFAVVLLTPDDVGRAAAEPDPPRPRARQNVVMELGYFMGRLGRSRVCAMLKGGVEVPSDYDGVVYIPMDDPKSWRLDLARELKAAGVDVDLNKAV